MQHSFISCATLSTSLFVSPVHSNGLIHLQSYITVAVRRTSKGSL